MHRQSQRTLLPALALAALTTMSVSPAAGQDTVGVIADRGRANPPRAPFVHVFDPGTMQITASIPLPILPFASVFDVEIAPDLGEAYVSDFDNNQLWVIDLRTSPPSLASGINPIPVTGPAPEDLALTTDGRYLLVSTGNTLASAGGTGSSLSVVDVRTRTEVSTVNFAPNCPIAVETSPDGSVLVSEMIAATPTFHNTNVRRFRIDRRGTLTDTGDVVGISALPGVQNLLVPNYPWLPGKINALLAQHTVHVSRPAGQTMGSLRTRGLTVAQSVTLDYPTGIDLCFDSLRSILYVRSNELGSSGGAGVGNSKIDGYLFLPFTGQFGERIVSIPLERRAGTAFGVEQTALDPLARRLFVSGLAGPEVRVFDSLTGARVGTISHPDFLWGVGINLRRRGW